MRKLLGSTALLMCVISMPAQAFTCRWFTEIWRCPYELSDPAPPEPLVIIPDFGVIVPAGTIVRPSMGGPGPKVIRNLYVKRRR